MAHSVSGYVLYISMWFNTKFVRVAYIFVDEGLAEIKFSETYPNFYTHFQSYKEDLAKIYQYNRKINYWEWVFLRGFNIFKNDQKRIFVPYKEYIFNKKHFRFALVNAGLFPAKAVTAILKKNKYPRKYWIYFSLFKQCNHF